MSASGFPLGRLLVVAYLAVAVLGAVAGAAGRTPIPRPVAPPIGEPVGLPPREPLTSVPTPVVSPTLPPRTAVPTATATPTPTPTATATPPPPSPPRVEDRTFQSASLGRRMPYLVYLPRGYDSEPAQRYPVLYMLHGMGGHDTEWRDVGLFEAADRLIAAGDVPPLVIVLPQGDQAYWVDHVDSGPRWGAYTARDVVAEVDGRFRTLPDPARRAIGGLSMGAHGALQLAMTYPGIFGVVGAHSPTFRRHDDAPSYFGDAAYFAAHNPVDLFPARAAAARSLNLWVDVGQQDTWRPAAEEFRERLTASGIPATWREYPGVHNPDYWRAHTAEYLRFYGEALR